ncbi:hypothetical protein AGMMS49965_00960 [Bacteroidia bacterium]|nr:hypothetical protein AGMMS49965_00960 [Bacteroidia bacterium]
MKKSYLRVAVMAAFAGVMMTGCGSSKQAAGNYSKPAPGSPFSAVYEAPCAELDSDEYFTATGIASGSKNRMDVLQTSALTNAQNIVRQKMQHAYKGVIDDYSSAIGNNNGTDYAAKVERGGSQIIMAVINETKAVCGPKFSAVDDRGDVSCYVGIRISKKELAKKITNHLAKDEVAGIREDETNFRKRMEEQFSKFTGE